jgi:asparagine synthase (glutamine-hydrolysing)
VVSAQSSKWRSREVIETSRDALSAELANSALAQRCLDLPWLRNMLENWPKTGWRNPGRESEYRSALLRGVAMGRFILDIEGGNA